MPTKKHRPQARSLSSYVSMVILGLLCVSGSFAVGVQTAGDVQTVAPTEATGTEVTGDMNGNGLVDEEDVTIILEIAKGYRDATPEQLRVDPNGDGRLTIDDALRLLHDLASL